MPTAETIQTKLLYLKNIRKHLILLMLKKKSQGQSYLESPINQGVINLPLKEKVVVEAASKVLIMELDDE